MAYVSPSTKTTGTLITAAIWNQDIVSNVQAGVPDIFTAAGDIVYATAADVAGRLALGGTAYQTLRVNSAVTAPEWGNGVVSGTTVSYIAPFTGTASAGGQIPSANNVYCVRFWLPHYMTIASVHAEVTTAAGTNGSFGIYSADGNTRHITSGAVSTASTGVKSVTLGAAVTLVPEFYWFAYSSDNASVRWRGIDLTNYTWFNGGTVQYGVAANAASAGVLPSTLGGVSAPTYGPVATCKLQG